LGLFRPRCIAQRCAAEPGPTLSWLAWTLDQQRTASRFAASGNACDNHYRGDGEFMISGANTSRYRKLFKPQML
jgi:hypothetical protein